jgi:hypothetical protein
MFYPADDVLLFQLKQKQLSVSFAVLLPLSAAFVPCLTLYSHCLSAFLMRLSLPAVEGKFGWGWQDFYTSSI